jgi:integrase
MYHTVISWKNPENGQKMQQSRSTGLKEKGNRKRALDMLQEKKAEQEALLRTQCQAKDFRNDTSRILLVDVIWMWLRHTEVRVRPTTFRAYWYMATGNIIPYFQGQEIRLMDLRPRDVLDFQSYLLAHKAPITAANIIICLRSILEYAVDYELVDQSWEYSVGRKIAAIRSPKGHRNLQANFLRPEEMQALLRSVKGHSMELAVILGGFFGLRRGEMLGLKWEAVRWETNEIMIYHTVAMGMVDRRTVLIETDATKSNNSQRTLPLVSPIRERLWEIKEAQEKDRDRLGEAYQNPDGYIYVNAMGKRMAPEYLSTLFGTWLEKHGFRRIRLHDLRHSCASLLLEAGVSLKMIQEWLGHANISMTAKYMHLIHEKSDAAMALRNVVFTDAAGKNEKEKEGIAKGYEMADGNNTDIGT